jgi:hypothetical protein
MHMKGQPRKHLLTEYPPKMKILIISGTLDIYQIILQCFNITGNSFTHTL